MTNRSKVKTAKEKDRDRVYALALTGDVPAMRTLCKVYGYTTITVDGKVVNLKEI